MTRLPSKPNTAPDNGKAKADLERIWRKTDEQFRLILQEKLLYKRPIPLRHPFIFYALHLAAFSIRLVNIAKPGAIPSHEFDGPYTQGIDPPADENAPPTNTYFPSWEEAQAYVSRSRRLIMSMVGHGKRCTTLQHAFKLIVEHELMHLETLKYMLAQTHIATFYPLHEAETIECEKVRIQSGTVIPGVPKREGYESLLDNEHDIKPRFVKPFMMAKYAVTNLQYLQFIKAGGYAEKSLWDDHWSWIKKNGIQMPATWRKRGNTYEVSYVATEQDDESEIAQRPAIVSIAEANAYAKWKGARLATEEEWVRAAMRDGEEPLFDRGWLPVHKGSVSWSGVVGLCGNGWELTSTLFESFEGFEPSVLYPLYSEEFFDGNHYVLKGASPFTDPLLSRTSFRNFFQPCYRYMMAKFRLVWDENQ